MRDERIFLSLRDSTICGTRPIPSAKSAGLLSSESCYAVFRALTSEVSSPPHLGNERKDACYSDAAADDRLRVSVLDERVIQVAIKPAFAGLGGSDHGMPAGVGVFAGVFVRRTVAAKGRAAGLAGPQMNPVRADLDAFGAFEDFGKFDCADRVDVWATSG